MDWIRLAQDRDQRRALVDTIVYLRIPKTAVNFLTSRVTVCFPRGTLLQKVSLLNDAF
jgi:hypothetical protein